MGSDSEMVITWQKSPENINKANSGTLPHSTWFNALFFVSMGPTPAACDEVWSLDRHVCIVQPQRNSVAVHDLQGTDISITCPTSMIFEPNSGVPHLAGCRATSAARQKMTCYTCLHDTKTLSFVPCSNATLMRNSW
jgi:hypothetical protein